jgi:ABC-type glycerol-3-phosphate transport system substrate-binding protein
MSKKPRLTRRAVLGTAAAATLPLVHIRTAGAAGKLSLALWDHWVPASNGVMKAQIDAWGEKNKVEVSVDFITSVGFKIELTAAAQYQARKGHDLIFIPNWDVSKYADRLEPVDDVIAELEKRYGAYSETYGYLAKSGNRWRAIPSSTGSLNLTACARISMFKQHAGIDLRELYPAAPQDKTIGDSWDYDAFLKAAEACHKAGVPFALGLGQTNDSINNTGAWYAAFGAQLIDANGKIQVKSDKTQQFLEYAQKLVKFLPNDAASYDDASNNRALISGKSALIMNPPSAWAVAKRDAIAVAEDCWTFPMPKGPAGRFIPFNYAFYGIWDFGSNKTAAKELAMHLQERANVEPRCVASEGYDLPPLVSMSDFDIWSKVTPPTGTIYNYPIRPWHDAKPSMTAAPAPHEIAVQVFQRAVHPAILARLQRGESIKKVTDWAQDELEGFTK